jgi:pyridoxamine 5'-phosphate oxidase
MSGLPADLPANPLPLFCEWFEHALQNSTQPNRDAMTLATQADGNHVTARIVLCKQVVPDPGYLLFYTNYESAKGMQINANPNVAVVFHWDDLGRQVRIEGIASQSPREESDRYFASRDRESRIGAWTSEQSRTIDSHAELLEKHASMQAKFAEPHNDGEIPRPPNWGGYRIVIRAIELWHRGSARLHERARWERPLDIAGGTIQAGQWQAKRLQP